MVAARAEKAPAQQDKQAHTPTRAAETPDLAAPELTILPNALTSAAGAGAPPGAPPPPRDVLQMQRTYGNHATQKLLGGSATPAKLQREADAAPPAPKTRPNAFQSALENAAGQPAFDPAPGGPVMGAASSGSPGPATLQRGMLDDARAALGGLDPTALISQARSLLSGGDEAAEQSQGEADSQAEQMGAQAEATAGQGDQQTQAADQAAQQEQAQGEQQEQQAQTQGEAGQSQIDQAGAQGAQEIESMGSAAQGALSLEAQLTGAAGGAAGAVSAGGAAAGGAASAAAQTAGTAGGAAGAQTAETAGGAAGGAAGAVAAGGAAAGASAAMAAATSQGFAQDAAQGLSCPEADILSTAAGLGKSALNAVIRGADALTGGMASRVAALAQRVGSGLARGARFVNQAIEQVAGAVKQRVTQMAQPLINVVNRGVQAATTLYHNVRTRITNAVQTVTQTVARGVSWVRENGPRLIQRGIARVQSAVGGAVERVASMVGGAVRAVISKLPGGSTILTGIDRLRAKITSTISAIRAGVQRAVERGQQLGERVLQGARSLADRTLQAVVQKVRSAADTARNVVQGIRTVARTIYETVVPAPVRRLAGQAREFIGQQVDRVRGAAGEVMKKIEGAVCVPLNEIAEPCIDQYLPFSEGSSEKSPNSTTATGGTSSSITLSSSAAVTIPLIEFGIPGSAEVGRGASVSVRRSGARSYGVTVSGESTLAYVLEAASPGTGSVTVDLPAGNGDAARGEEVWRRLSGGGAAAADPGAGGGSTGAGMPTAKAGIKAGTKRNISVDYGFNVANSTCDLMSMAGLLSAYGVNGAISAIVPPPFSSIVGAAGTGAIMGGWASHITGLTLTDTNSAEASAKASAPGEGSVSGKLGAEQSQSVGLQRQEDGSFRPEASFSQGISAEIAGEMKLGGLFTAGASLGAQGTQSLTLIYDRNSGLITPSSLATTISATLGVQGFNVSAFPAEFIPPDAASIITQNLDVLRRVAVRGNISASLSLTSSNLEGLTNHVYQYLATAPIDQITWAGVMTKVREGMQQVALDRRLTVTLTEIARAGISGEGEVNAEGTTLGIQASVSAERRIVHTLYSNTTRMSGPALNPPAPNPVVPPGPAPEPDHPEPVHPGPQPGPDPQPVRPGPQPGPGPQPRPGPTPPPSHKNPLDMTADELEADTAAQNELFEMAQETRARQTGFGNQVISDSHAEGTVYSILKRGDFDGFIAGVLEKVRRKNYPRVGDMPDIVRGRFNMARLNDVNQVVASITSQTNYRVIEVVAPRERAGVANGYPRWHIVVADSSGIIHEWQIGTQAVTDVYETEGIEVPSEVGDLPEGMHKDLHDIEYDILANIERDHPDIAAEVGIPAFRTAVAQASAEAGEHGADMPDKNERIVALHNQCSAILRLLVDRHGPDIIRKYFKHGQEHGAEAEEL